MFADKILLKVKLLSGSKIKMKMRIDGVMTLTVKNGTKVVVETVKMANDENAPTIMVNTFNKLLKLARKG